MRNPVDTILRLQVIVEAEETIVKDRVIGHGQCEAFFRGGRRSHEHFTGGISFEELDRRVPV